ncbi:Putative hydrolase-like protein [Cladobotryum mycophilum]|uniref:Hydrolase-like protein n=1 Tax=Cladobotryum mycophilum TaxID=491253 RepID=A0ABR0SLW4_9HYPO
MFLRRHVLLAYYASATLAVAGVNAAVGVGQEDPDFDWESTKPSSHLEYHACYGEFKCARLEVPLNWLNQSDPRKATIAMIKLPALVPDHDPTFGGPILVNPGGPGGSGVDFLLTRGHRLRQAADKPGRRHYEIVSFDPRGVSRTTPRSDCFPKDFLARSGFLLEARGSGAPTNGDNAISYNLAMMEILSQRCERSGDAMNYVGTPSVARDMIEMIDKIDELQKHEASHVSSEEGPLSESESRLELRKRATASQVPRLRYIGFSYGTVLGNYFASMFPGRVGRMVLDGVCNADDFATGPGWLTNTVDADKIFDTFLQGCADAGPKICALARETDESGSDIKARFNSFLAGLYKKPIPFLSNTGETVIITGDDITTMIGTVLYKPITGFKHLASLLDGLMSGRPEETAQALIGSRAWPLLRKACPINNDTSPHEPEVLETQNAVICSDGDDITDKDLSWWRKYVSQQQEISSILGALWSTIRLPCSAWRFRANWQFKGPFTSPEADPALVPDHPAAPILFLSNRLDPVTPLRAARAMAERHPGAKVVVQEAMGHCTFGSATSSCIDKVMADYFESGAPPRGSCLVKSNVALGMKDV